MVHLCTTILRSSTTKYTINAWFQVNVIHDVIASVVSVYIDRKLKLNVLDHGGVFHYFKCGVYAQNYSSYFMHGVKMEGDKTLEERNLIVQSRRYINKTSFIGVCIYLYTKELILWLWFRNFIDD